MSNPEQTVAEQGDSNSSFSEHLKEKKASGEQVSFAVFKVLLRQNGLNVQLRLCVRKSSLLSSVP